MADKKFDIGKRLHDMERRDRFGTIATIWLFSVTVAIFIWFFFDLDAACRASLNLEHALFGTRICGALVFGGSLLISAIPPLIINHLLKIDADL